MFHSLLKQIVTPFSDFIFPPHCFVCEQRLDNGGVRLCSECWSSFRSFNVGDKVWHEINGRFTEGKVGGFLSCYYFEKDGKLQDVIHLLKYRGIKSMGVMLGREIGERIRQDGRFSTADCLVPVPLHSLKQRERGYNQSEMLCGGISEVTRIPTNRTIIRRCKYTQSQTQFNLAERRENMKDAFEIPQKRLPEVQGKTVVLVDDVITTGSTMISCAGEFIRAGAKKVLAVSAAVAE